MFLTSTCPQLYRLVRIGLFASGKNHKKGGFFGGACGSNLAVVGENDGLCKGETQTTSRCGATGIGAVETLENMWQIFC